MQLPKHIATPDPGIYRSQNYVVLDFETTNLEKGNPLNLENHIVHVSWYKGGVIYSIHGSEYEMSEVVKACEQADFIVAHNAKFELQWLVRCGLDLTKVVVFDTMIAAYVINGNTTRNYTVLALDFLVKQYIPESGGKVSLVSKLIKAGVCPSMIPASWLGHYCEEDVRITHDLFKALLKIMDERGLLPVFYTRCLFTPVLADIEFNGMCLDEEVVTTEYEKQKKVLHYLQLQMDDITGGINFRSSKQMSKFLYEDLKFPVPKRYGKPIVNAKGDHPTGQAILDSFKPKTKKQKVFLEFRKQIGKVNAALTKNLEFFYGVCKDYGGIFYGQFNQTITKTHRLSSSGRSIYFKSLDDNKAVQFQNMPRQYKALFKARKPGWLIAEADGAQLEFRVAGHCGRDEVIKHDVINKTDVHSNTAKAYTEAGEPMSRQDAKARTFRPLFGGKSGTEADIAYIAFFNNKYHQVAKTQAGWVDEVLRTKQLTLETGLIVYWPDTTMTANGYITNTTQIYNLPIQNLATAEIIPVSITYLWHYLKAYQMKSFLVNTIHDSGVAEVHPEEKEKYAELAELSFTTDVYNYLKKVYNIEFTIPLEVEIKFGKWWGGKVCHKCNQEYNPLMGEHECQSA